MELYDLPDGWEWTTIGDLADVNPSMGFPEYLNPDSLVSFVPMAAVDELLGAIVAVQDRPIKEVWKGYKRFATGDVIFARITPCMENGKSAVAIELTNGIGLGSTEFIVIRPEKGISNQWIYRFVRQKSFRDDAIQDMTGTAGQLRVSKEYIERATIPLAPTAEQRRIVEKIEALFAQSRISREVLDEIPELVRQFRQSVLAAAFRGDLTERDPQDEPADVLLERILEARYQRWRDDLIAKGKNPDRVEYIDPVAPDTSDLPELPEGWCWATFDQLLYDFKNGYSLKPAFEPPGIPILRISAVRPMSVSFDDLRYVRDKIENVAEYLIENGDLLFTRYNGSVNLVGVCGVVRNIDGEILYPDKLMRARVLDEYVSPDYLEFYFATQHARLHMESKMKSSAGQNGVSGSDVKSTPVILMSYTEQNQLASKIAALFFFADTIDLAVESARHNIDQLEQSILQRAFEGRLVPQDPDDEPAAELLARIRALREKGQTKQPHLPGID